MEKFLSADKDPTDIPTILKRVEVAREESPIIVFVNYGELYAFFGNTVKSERMRVKCKENYVGSYYHGLSVDRIERELKQAVEG